MKQSNQLEDKQEPKDGNKKPKDDTFHPKVTVLQIQPHVHIHFAYFLSNATNGKWFMLNLWILRIHT